MVLFKKKRIELGDGHIIQYTLFEHKKIGGIWLYNWKTIKQNRFHTHAFNSIAFLLRGGYTEQVIRNTGVIEWNKVNQWLKPRFLPMNYTHRICEAEPNTWTIVFFGPWKKYWYEFFEDTKTWVKYTWGRKVVNKIEAHEGSISSIIG